MKKYILLLLLAASSLITLSAEEAVKVEIRAHCSESKKEEFNLNFNSNLLNLSEDAIQDNTGGYVDIPEDSYYIKTQRKVYRLNGVVEKSYKNNSNQFTSKILNSSKNLINAEELYSLKSAKNLKFIQKIKLAKSKKVGALKALTTTNTLNIYFDEKQFDGEYQKCKEQIKEVKEEGLLDFFKI